MLSILIPTYNHECVALVDELVNQIDASGIVAEVVVIDDGSTNLDMLAENACIEDMPHCRYIVSVKNQGIVKTRNALMDLAKYDLLLFLDSDIWPKSEDFLTKYIAASEQADVVVGGLDYRRGEEVLCNPLRWKYGITHEIKSPEARARHPYDAFLSSNFLIHRNVVDKVRFDESFDRYGHEDTLYGAALQQAGLTIAHIDNAVFHDDTDTQEQYLSKVRIAIQSLSMHAEQLEGKSRLLQAYKTLVSLHLTRPVYAIFRYFRTKMEKNLLGKKPSMLVLNIYKISYLCGVMRL